MELETIVKELRAIKQRHFKIQFLDKRSLEELKSMYKAVKEYSIGVTKIYPEYKVQSFDIDNAISELSKAIYKERISDKKLAWYFDHYNDLIRLRIDDVLNMLHFQHGINIYESEQND